MLESLDLAPPRRVSIVGVGSEQRRDDAAGMVVLENLEPIDNERVQLVSAGVVPENFTAPIRRFDPDVVLLLDAVDFGGNPGTVKRVEPVDLETTSFSSHAYPLTMFVEFVEGETGADVFLIGIQPNEVDHSEGLSQPVENAVQDLSEYFQAELRE